MTWFKQIIQTDVIQCGSMIIYLDLFLLPIWSKSYVGKICSNNRTASQHSLTSERFDSKLTLNVYILRIKKCFICFHYITPPGVIPFYELMELSWLVRFSVDAGEDFHIAKINRTTAPYITTKQIHNLLPSKVGIFFKLEFPTTDVTG